MNMGPLNYSSWTVPECVVKMVCNNDSSCIATYLKKGLFKQTNKNDKQQNTKEYQQNITELFWK